MGKTGKTTGNLKLRSGPGMQFEPPLAFLEPNTPLEVLDDQGDWLHVRAAGKEGYVGRKYVEVSESEEKFSGLAHADGGGDLKKPEAGQPSAPARAAGMGGLKRHDEDDADKPGGMTKRSAPPKQMPTDKGKTRKDAE